MQEPVPAATTPNDGAGASGAAGSAAASGTAWAPAATAHPVTAVHSSDVPADFDADRFIHGAKVYFVRLQGAFDNNRADDLREFTSPEMFAELSLDLMQRGQEQQTTDVVTLDARLLGVERTGEADATELASVRFDGMLRESSDAAAAPFAEVWNFTRPADRSAGWVLAGIQQVE
jgi:predicted lipid-binding transport protein (Tim44 family)